MTSREYRQTSGALHEVRVTADGRGRLVADVMKYNVVDDYRTTFTPRCFSASLETRMPRILWSHNAHDPIGQWIDADDTSERLRLAGVLDLAMVRDSEGRETGTPAVPSAHRAWAQLSSRTIDQFSVGFLRQAEERNTPRQGVTAITQALLDEASPILVGSVPGAELVSIRSTQRIFDMGQGRRLRLFPSETRAGKGGQFAKGGGRVPGSGGGGAPRMNSGAAAKADYAKGLAKTAKADDEAGLVKYKTTGVKAKLRPQVKKLRRQAEDAERQATIHEKNLQRDPNGPLARADKESARFLKKHAEELKAMADELEKDSRWPSKASAAELSSAKPGRAKVGSKVVVAVHGNGARVTPATSHEVAAVKAGKAPHSVGTTTLHVATARRVTKNVIDTDNGQELQRLMDGEMLVG